MTDVVDLAPSETEPLVRMLPAEAYTSAEVLAWERRHLFAGSWTCLGRLEDLFGDEATNQRAVRIGEVGALVVRQGDALRMYANTCRHRGHELLADGESAGKRMITCPYHAWTYDLGGELKGAPGFRGVEGFDPAEHALVELPVREWQGWVFGHALHRSDTPEVPSFETHLGAITGLLEPYVGGLAGHRRPAHLRGRRELEGDRRELPRVLPLPPDPSGAVPGLATGLG